MNPAKADRVSGGKDGSQRSDRGLPIGRVSRPGVSRIPSTPFRKGSVPLGRSDGALLRENLQRVDEFPERTAITEESLRGMAAVLERTAPAIDDIIRHSGGLSREGS